MYASKTVGRIFESIIMLHRMPSTHSPPRINHDVYKPTSCVCMLKDPKQTSFRAAFYCASHIET